MNWFVIVMLLVSSPQNPTPNGCTDRYFYHRIPYRVFGDAKQNLRLHFHPAHWSDLKKSGLSDDTIWAAGIFSVPPDHIASILKFNPSHVVSAMAFPYLDIDFIRLKVFPTLIDKNGSRIKYLQGKKTGVHLYITPNFKNRFLDPQNIIYFVEGEKKALRGDQEGLCCVGLAGIYGWKESGKKGVIPEIYSLPLKNRTIRVVPDSDVTTNPMVARGTTELCHELEVLGARVQVLNLRRAA